MVELVNDVLYVNDERLVELVNDVLYLDNQNIRFTTVTIYSLCFMLYCVFRKYRQCAQYTTYIKQTHTIQTSWMKQVYNLPESTVIYLYTRSRLKYNSHASYSLLLC